MRKFLLHHVPLLTGLALLLCCSYDTLAQPNCNANINVSVDANCNALIDADDLLAGSPMTGIQYTIMIKTSRPGMVLENSTSGSVIVDGVADNGQSYNYIGRTLVGEIFNGIPGAPGVTSCWVDILFEDKLPPVFDPVVNEAFTCLDDLSCAAEPTATDNCGGTVTVNLTGTQTLGGDICSPGGFEIVRTFIAFDQFGNVSAPTTQLITVTQPDVTFPRDISFTCEQYTAYPNITDAAPRSSCIFDVVDDNNDGTFNTDDDDPTQDDDIITVGLIPGFDDASPVCAPFGERDGADGSACGTEAVCNLSASALPPNTTLTPFTCAQPQVNGLEDDDVLAATGAGTPLNVEIAAGGACMFLTTFTDDTLAACGGAANNFKILRSWRVLNWCDNSVFTDLQVIKVTDQVDPVVTIDPEITLTANVAGVGPHGLCGSSGILPLPTLTDNCSGIDLSTLTVFSPGLFTGVPVNDPVTGTVVGFTIPAPFLPIGGPYTVTYQVADSCGNMATATTEVTVEDRTPPTATCVQITSLNVTTSPESALFANSLDNGSIDDCGDVFFKILRQDELDAASSNTFGFAVACNGANDNSTLENPLRVYFDDEALFCCEDAGNTIAVVVRVFDIDPGSGPVVTSRMLPGGDLFGRFNDCPIDVIVNDNIGPIPVCNASVTLECGDPLIDDYLDAANVTFNAPTFVDNCLADVTLEIIGALDPMCNTGSFVRSFTATDASGNSANCTQTVTVNPVNDYTITFPNDFLVECGENSSIAPDSSDIVVSQGECDMLAFSTVDQTFEFFGSGDTAKIIRCYTVLNWCENRSAMPSVIPNNPNSDLGATLDVFSNTTTTNVTVSTDPAFPNVATGFFTYCQTIEFEAGDNAVLSGQFSGCNGFTQEPDGMGGCTTEVIIDIDAVAGCSPITGFDYFVVTNIDNQAPLTVVTQAELATGTSFEGNGDGDPFGDFTTPAATGFEAQVTGNYPLGDHALVVTPLDGSGAQTIIPFSATDCVSPSIATNATILIPITENPTTGDGEAIISFADVAQAIERCGPTFDSIRLFTGNFNDPFFEEIVVDCSNQMIGVDVKAVDQAGLEAVQINLIIMLSDPDNLCTNFRAPVGGRLSTLDGTGFPGVRVSASGDYFNNVTTDSDGSFEFPDVTIGSDISVTPYNNNGISDGVTALDYYYIGRHLLGYEPFTEPEQFIAADVNNSGHLSGFDLTTLRRLVLSLDTEYPNGQTSWRFIDADYVFPQPTNPWAEVWPEVVSINDHAAAMMTADFNAVKIGDVNHSAAPLTSPLAPRTGSSALTLETQDVLIGQQTPVELTFSTADLQALGYQATLEWDPAQVEVLNVLSAGHPAEGFGTHLLDQGQLTMAHVGELSGELFTLVVRAKRGAVASSEAFKLTSALTSAIGFTADGTQAGVDLRFNGETVGAAVFSLSQNRPNPFSDRTMIDFVLAEAGTATLTITDLAGRVVWQRTAEYAQGRSTVEISSAELTHTGVLTYTLTSGSDSATRRLVVLD